jgi:hypothetical protein
MGSTSGNPPRFAPNIPFPGDHSAFLRADNKGDIPKTYLILVEDADNTGGSGLDLGACRFSINNKEAETRLCNGELKFKVGKPATGADCTTEGNTSSTCRVKVWAKDMAKNVTTTRTVHLIDSDERNFVTTNANIFEFGVDWTPPTAQ